MIIAIVEDIKADRLLLEQTLKKYGTINGLSLEIRQYENGEALLQHYHPYEYTLIFLDIYMDGISGIETASRIRAADHDTAIVFLTSSEEHRPEAFSVFATGYLIKPCSEEETFRTLDHILRIHTDKSKYFPFSYERKNYSLPFAEIVSIRSDGNYLLIQSSQGKEYRTRMTFSYAETQVDSRFLTIIKGIMVNMDCIEQIKDTICTMKNGSRLPVQVKNEKDIRQKWLNYKFAKIRKTTEIFGKG